MTAGVGEAGRAESGPFMEGVVEGARPPESGALCSGGETAAFGTKSSSGGMWLGRGATEGLAGVYFLSAFWTSGRNNSSSRRCCLSYIIDDRTCSISAAVTSSVTRRLCLANERCRFCEMPSARRARICSYLSAWWRGRDVRQ